MAKIELVRNGSVIASSQAPEETALLFKDTYEEGDALVFTADTKHAIVKVDQQIAPARVYLPEKTFTYRLPLSGDGLVIYPPNAFGGNAHLISIQPDKDNSYRNVACNPADQRGDVTAWPHATANVETRNESCFAARNVIDGEHIAAGHGEWPYGSWGIGARTDAELTLDFGRPMAIDTLVLYLRADFPHDAYWIEGTLQLDDGTSYTFPLVKKDGPQSIPLGSHIVQQVKLTHMVKNDDPSAFPALRQIEIYGREHE